MASCCRLGALPPGGLTPWGWEVDLPLKRTCWLCFFRLLWGQWVHFLKGGGPLASWVRGSGKQVGGAS